MGAWSDYNRSAAFQSLEGMRNANTTLNLDNYTAIQQMTNASAMDNASTAVTSLMTPFNSFWASNALWGSWFYVFLIFFTVGTVYIKSQDLYRTSIAMLFMGLLAVAPASAGVLYIPATALHVLYIMTGVGLAGAMYQVWVSD